MVGPIAPERNPPINPQYYIPSRFVISDLVRGVNTLITTSEEHNYVIGQEVRVLIPIAYGCREISGQTGFVIDIPSDTQVLVNINSVDANAFIASPSYTRNVPQILAIGDTNSGPITPFGTGTLKTTISGSFINVSPL